MEEITESTQSVKPTCASCGAKLKGEYCRKCGEKKIIPARDFSLVKFLNLTLWHFIHFDSKLLRTCGLLYSKPGFLTAEWIAGRRVKYMKPLQLFVVASVLFYFFLPTTMAHFVGYKDLITGYQAHNYVQNSFQYDFKTTFEQKAAALQITEDALVRQLNTTAAHKSKACLFLVIPLWGCLIFGFFRQKIPWIAPHLIFAMHGLVFYILLDLSIHAVLFVTGLNIGRNILAILIALFTVYQTLAVHRVYGHTWLVTVLKTIGIMAGFVAIVLIYRQIMTIWAINDL